MRLRAPWIGTKLQAHEIPFSVVADPTQSVNALLTSGRSFVSVDVFDTLLWRETLFPADAFMKLLPASPRLGLHARAFAERCTTSICRRLLRSEPTLDDIYRLLPSHPARELQIEKDICVANPMCLEWVSLMLKRGVRLVAISDMYLSAEQIGQLLQKCGYPPIPIYSSATEQQTKSAAGKLFMQVWRHHHVQAADAIHVGDNPHSDIAMAQQLGAATCHLSTPRETLFSVIPALAKPSENIHESVAWGQVAIRLHTHLASAPSQRAQLCTSLALRSTAPSAQAVHHLLDDLARPNAGSDNR